MESAYIIDCPEKSKIGWGCEDRRAIYTGSFHFIMGSVTPPPTDPLPWPFYPTSSLSKTLTHQTHPHTYWMVVLWLTSCFFFVAQHLIIHYDYIEFMIKHAMHPLYILESTPWTLYWINHSQLNKIYDKPRLGNLSFFNNVSILEGSLSSEKGHRLITMHCIMWCSAWPHATAYS